MLGKKTKEKFPGDDELFTAVKNNDLQMFSSKLNAAYISQLRFTDTLWNILHLCIYYKNKEFVALILDLESAKKLIQGKDKNGETPLHLACFLTDADITMLLLAKGASFYTRNIYQKDPIDIIPNYVNRKAFLIFLLNKKSKLKLKKKELDFLIEHQRKCEYHEALAEIIFADDNLHQFKIERGLVIKPEFEMIKYQGRSRAKNIQRLQEFKMGFREKEDFYLPKDDNNRKGGRRVNLRDEIMSKKSLLLNPMKSHINLTNYVTPSQYVSELPDALPFDAQEAMSEIITPGATERLMQTIGHNINNAENPK